MNELEPLIRVRLDGDDSVDEQMANLADQLDRMRADGYIRDWELVKE